MEKEFKWNEVREKRAKRLVAEAGKEKPTMFMKFHSKFMTWNFKCMETGKSYTKGEFWDSFRDLALLSIKDYVPDSKERKLIDTDPPSGFMLIKNPVYAEWIKQKEEEENKNKKR